MGKLVIIAGNRRAGKTTTCNRLAKDGYIYLKFDYLLDAFDNHLDELSIFDKNERHQQEFEFFNNLVNRYYEDAQNYNQNIVFDIYDFLPFEMLDLDKIDDVYIYYLIYPDATVSQIIDCLGKYGDEFEWNKKLSIDEANIQAKDIFTRNNLIKDECEKNNITYFDVSILDNRIKQLDKLYNEIKELK